MTTGMVFSSVGIRSLHTDPDGVRWIGNPERFSASTEAVE